VPRRNEAFSASCGLATGAGCSENRAEWVERGAKVIGF